MTRIVPRPEKREPLRVSTHRLSINIGMLGTNYAFMHRLGTTRYEVHFRDIATGGRYFDIEFKQRANSVEFLIPSDRNLVGAEWQVKVMTL